MDERPADPARRRRTSLLVQVGDDHIHALGRQPLGDPRPDPGHAPSHQGDLPVKLHNGILRHGADIPAGPTGYPGEVGLGLLQVRLSGRAFPLIVGHQGSD
jgi:hypothetical protein